MNANPGQAASEFAWGVYKQWAKTSRAAKKRLNLWQKITIGASILALVLGPIAVGHLALTWLCSAIVALVAFFNKQLLGTDRQQSWVQARQSAEAIKSETFRRLTSAPPYAAEAAEADATLLKRVEEIHRLAEAIPRETATAEEKLDGFPRQIDGAAYLQLRVVDQIGFYETNSAGEQKTADGYKHLGLALGALVIVVGIPAPFLMHGTVEPWAPVISALAGLLGAQIAQSRTEFLARRYRAAGDRLQFVKQRFGSGVMTPERCQALADQAEQVIMAENAAWVSDQLGLAKGSDPAK